MKASRIWLGVPAVALMLVGCGQQSSSQTPAGGSSIELSSPAVGADGVISPHVKCGAGTIWLPLKWGSIPSETEELILYFGRVRRVAVDGAQRIRVPFADMLSGINPELHGMAANTFPLGAEPLNFGFAENCLPVRTGQKLLVELFALDHPQGVPPNDEFVTRLAEEALGVAQYATASKAASEFREDALATGRFTAIYGPG